MILQSIFRSSFIGKISVLTIFLLFAVAEDLSAQIIGGGVVEQTFPEDVDTNYVEVFPGQLTGRLYLSRKYTNFTVEDRNTDITLNYEPNTTLNLGIGVTVESFSLNLAYGFDFLNPDVGKGNTRYLDLQSHMYSRKFTIDFFGQFYKGLYLSNTQDLVKGFEDPYYVRPDIYEQIIGGQFQYVFNNRKYSYRAGLIQNERQKKSAGSFLLGADVYYGLMFGDSAIVPTFVDDSSFVSGRTVDRISFFKLGPNVGYAHTFVVAERFFFMLSVSLNFGFGASSTNVPGEGVQKDSGLDVGAFGRFALGYNGPNWYLGLSTVDNTISASRDSENIYSQFGIGNVRFNYARRFIPGPKVKKVLSKLP